MPTYEYRCRSCGHHFEVFQTITAEPLSDCPQCAGPVERQISTGGGFIIGSSAKFSDRAPCCGRDERCHEAPSNCGGCCDHEH
ncbi:MAG TPA: zinc ribbon domain-containing protein [bacterium]|jgi:putative FmdB family regulatory protein|nr:zinc ribbon domain-containing protein [bacterium]HPG44883.1 zinc ribbon domain-containing protein [bacterium]HPM98088.1 zinc ribbon domain-containing protein [bacterium]